jgi:hypothetical protein
VESSSCSIVKVVASSPLHLVNMSHKAVAASEVRASELEHYVRVEKECKLLQAIHTADTLHDALMRQKRVGSSVWWKQFTPVKMELADTEQKQRWWTVRLQCNECNAFFSATNPSATCKGHLKGGMCRVTARRKTEVHSARTGAPEVTDAGASTF